MSDIDSSFDDFHREMRAEYMFANMVERDKRRKESLAENNVFSNLYQGLGDIAWKFKHQFLLPTDFDKTKYAISIDVSPD